MREIESMGRYMACGDLRFHGRGELAVVLAAGEIVSGHTLKSRLKQLPLPIGIRAINVLGLLLDIDLWLLSGAVLYSKDYDIKWMLDESDDGNPQEYRMTQVAMLMARVCPLESIPLLLASPVLRENPIWHVLRARLEGTLCMC